MVVSISVFHLMISDYITDMCNKSLNMTASNATDLHSVRLKSSKEEYYPHYLSCSLQILAEQNTEHLMIQFLHFDVRPEHYPEFCGYDYLDVRDGNSSNSPYVCGILVSNILRLNMNF